MSYSIGSTSTSRITGMVSGLDVDSLVEGLMTAEMYEYDKTYQDQQRAEWQMEAYQNVISTLTSFEDTYFSYSSDTNMLSSNIFNVMSATSEDSSITVTASSGALEGTHALRVTQLATAAAYESADSVSKSVIGDSAADYASLNDTSLKLEIDGVSRVIDLSEVTSVQDLQTSIDDMFGQGKIEVTQDGSGILSMDIHTDSGVTEIDISETDDSTLLALGFGGDSIQSNRLDTDRTLEELRSQLKTAFDFDSDGNVEFEINGEAFTFSSSTTIEEMMDEINSSTAADVALKYQPSTGTFKLQSDSTGEGDTLKLAEDESTFLTAIGLTSSNYTQGADAKFELDGVSYVRSENSFDMDGVLYEIAGTTDEAVTIGVAKDVTSAYEAIETFVDAYNAIVDAFETLVREDADGDYLPLTQAQKEEMEDEEIESWEKAAKVGILEDDKYITDLLDDMRVALQDSVNGCGLTLSEIGIETSSDYTEYGKLEIDEDILKGALEENSEAIGQLFTQASDNYPGMSGARDYTSSEMSTRYKEEGLMYRIYDAIESKISTSRDRSGYKGTLLELAGSEGDSSEYDNTLYNRIEDYEDELETLEDWLEEKEEEYYDKFTTMEAALSTMNSELEAIQSMLG